MTYLTRMTINAARRDARRLLGSPQAMHAAVLAAFPARPAAGGGSRVLWRLDAGQDEHRPLLYLLSPDPPDLTHIVERAGWPTLGETWQTRDYQPLLDRLTASQRWAFRLVANPVRRVRTDGHARGIVKAHVTAAQQTTWLLEQATNAGFEIAKITDGNPAVAVADRRTLTFRRQASTVTIATARFDGILTVTSTDHLRRVLLHGLGRGKAYGCGLLTLAPP